MDEFFTITDKKFGKFVVNTGTGKITGQNCTSLQFVHAMYSQRGGSQ